MSSAKRRKPDNTKRKSAKTSTSQKPTRSTPETPEGVFDHAIRHVTTKALTREQTVEFQSIVKAWSAFVTNDDEAMATALKTIGTQSIALDWKLLLRGFAAYSRNDDERAIENWRRVNTTRPCGKLAAAGLTMVGQASTANWKRIGTLLQNDVVIGLTELAHEVENTHDLNRALRLVKQRRTMFQTAGLIEPISNILYHAMYNHGEPRDVGVYLNLLPAPPRDPVFSLMTGLILHRAGDLDQSSDFLRLYGDWLSHHNQGWPREILRRAIAKVVVARAQLQLEAAIGDRFDPFAFFGFEQPKPKPSVEILPHLKQAQQFDPEWHELTLWLVNELPRTGEAKLACEMGDAYMSKNPDTWAMCEAVGIAHGVMGAWAKAIPFCARAMATDPLNKDLSFNLSMTATVTVLQQIIAGEFDAVVATFTQYDSKIHEYYPAIESLIRITSDLHHGRTESAEAILNGIYEEVETNAEFVYLWGAMITQIKVKPNIKKAATAQLSALWKRLKDKPQPGLALFKYWRLLNFGGIEYKGYKTHQKSILAAVATHDANILTPNVLFLTILEFIKYRRIAEAEVFVTGIKKAVDKGVVSILQAIVEESKPPKQVKQAKIDKYLDDAHRSQFRVKPEIREWLATQLEEFPQRNPLDFSMFVKTFQSVNLGADPYKVLEVPTTADDAAIRKAYMQKVRQYPPESHGNEFARVRQAYECLNNLDSRTNLWLFEHGLLDSCESMLRTVLAKLPRTRLRLDHVARAMD